MPSAMRNAIAERGNFMGGFYRYDAANGEWTTPYGWICWASGVEPESGFEAASRGSVVLV